MAASSGASGQADDGQPVGNAGFHARPAVQLADEDQLGLAVLDDLANGAGRQRGVQRHRDVAAHPDREVGHQPVRGVLGQQRHPVAGLQAQALQMGGHAPALVDDFAPGVVAHRSAAQRLRQRNAVRAGLFPVVEALEGQCVVRSGGGHDVAVLIESLSADEQDASRQVGIIAEKIREALARPYRMQEHEYQSSPSIGIALYRGNEASADVLLRHADLAMYQAKNAGGNSVCFFDLGMRDNAQRHGALEGELDATLKGQQDRGAE